MQFYGYRKGRIVFATGHCSPQESIILARKASAVGVKRFAVTYANSHFWMMTPDQILLHNGNETMY